VYSSPTGTATGRDWHVWADHRAWAFPVRPAGRHAEIRAEVGWAGRRRVPVATCPNPYK
jgi:hypothetical protein